MTGIFEAYLQEVTAKFSREATSEMGYRTDLENLLKKIFATIKVHQIDHDPKAAQHNKPDFVILSQSHSVPIMYLEAKDIGVSLDKIEKSEQMARYYGYANLVLTDYLEFRFYRNGLPYGEPIKLADSNLKTRAINPFPENFDNLAKTLLDFTQSHKEPIKSGQHLAKIMGGKAQRIRDNIRQFFSLDSGRESDLNKLYKTLKELLVHDLTPESFADMYAQTLVYGLFVARYNDKSLGSFSRREARELIPNSNPFLRNFFDHIVGIHFDDRLKFIVDELCEVFSHADVNQLMKQYFKTDLWGETHEQKDPVIHFYEDFLNEYDSGLRKKMGAYYTPPAVVNFIVRSVDYLLQKEFGLSGGVADTAKTKEGLHKVQILDPACGTGTFISAVIRIIYKRLLDSGQKGRWTTYVHRELLSRIYGFELMMTPYTIAHLKLGIAFKQTGFWDFHQRLGIYLTNSLEPSVKLQEDLYGPLGFSESIAKESKDAEVIKNEKPIMVVMGNPPYSVSSSNKGDWIQNLIKVYKQNLNEKKTNLDDDYIKFIRFAEHYIEKNGTGIVAMITNNSFIDGITHRQMRKHLLETFDDIYILDLHGSTKKKETTPDGGKDQNVFNIQQGVSISIFVRKNQEKKNLGEVYHSEISGMRNSKFKYLNSNSVQTIKWQKLNYSAPNYFFVPKDFRLEKEYIKGFKLSELFNLFSSGAESAKDSFIIDFSEEKILELNNFIQVYSAKEISEKYDLKIDKAEQVKNDIGKTANKTINILYRPFDIRSTLYSFSSQGLWWRPKSEVMKHLLQNNLALITCRLQTSFDYQHAFVTNAVTERCSISLQTGEVSYVFPLYLYSDDGTKTPNLKIEIVGQIEKIVGKTSPEEIFDYIYAMLHSPSYREKYKEFLKIDFPRVPFPKDKAGFKKLIKFGAKLRQLHLLEAPEVNQFITTYPVEGPNIVEKISYSDGKVFINKNQYFGQVSEIAWNFYIGGYQPAQKWLKDRKGRELTNEDIEHYQQMIVALTETKKIMKQIDKH